jgi:hypothetical protein
MRERNEAIEREVERWRERERIQRQIDLLNALIPVEHYRELKIAFQEAKVVQRKYHEKVKKLQDRNKPAHQKVSLPSRLVSRVTAARSRYEPHLINPNRLINSKA